MDALTGFKVLEDEFIDALDCGEDVKRVIKAASPRDGLFYKVESLGLVKLVAALKFLEISQHVPTLEK